jgi:hypothetical protein
MTHTYKIYDLRIMNFEKINSDRQIVGNKNSLIQEIAGTGLSYVLDAVEWDDIHDFEIKLIRYPMQYIIKLCN